MAAPARANRPPLLAAPDARVLGSPAMLASDEQPGARHGRRGAGERQDHLLNKVHLARPASTASCFYAVATRLRLFPRARFAADRAAFVMAALRPRRRVHRAPRLAAALVRSGPCLCDLPIAREANVLPMVLRAPHRGHDESQESPVRRRCLIPTRASTRRIATCVSARLPQPPTAFCRTLAGCSRAAFNVTGSCACRSGRARAARSAAVWSGRHRLELVRQLGKPRTSSAPSASRRSWRVLGGRSGCSTTSTVTQLAALLCGAATARRRVRAP